MAPSSPNSQRSVPARLTTPARPSAAPASTPVPSPSPAPTVFHTPGSSFRTPALLTAKSHAWHTPKPNLIRTSPPPAFHLHTPSSASTASTASTATTLSSIDPDTLPRSLPPPTPSSPTSASVSEFSPTKLDFALLDDHHMHIAKFTPLPATPEAPSDNASEPSSELCLDQNCITPKPLLTPCANTSPIHPPLPHPSPISETESPLQLLQSTCSPNRDDSPEQPKLQPDNAVVCEQETSTPCSAVSAIQHPNHDHDSSPISTTSDEIKTGATSVVTTTSSDLSSSLALEAPAQAKTETQTSSSHGDDDDDRPSTRVSSDSQASTVVAVAVDGLSSPECSASRDEASCDEASCDETSPCDVEQVKGGDENCMEALDSPGGEIRSPELSEPSKERCERYWSHGSGTVLRFDEDGESDSSSSYSESDAVSGLGTSPGLLHELGIYVDDSGMSDVERWSMTGEEKEIEAMSESERARTDRTAANVTEGRNLNVEAYDTSFFENSTEIMADGTLGMGFAMRVDCMDDEAGDFDVDMVDGDVSGLDDEVESFGKFQYVLKEGLMIDEDGLGLDSADELTTETGIDEEPCIVISDVQLSVGGSQEDNGDEEKRKERRGVADSSEDGSVTLKDLSPESFAMIRKQMTPRGEACSGGEWDEEDKADKVVVDSNEMMGLMRDVRDMMQENVRVWGEVRAEVERRRGADSSWGRAMRTVGAVTLGAVGLAAGVVLAVAVGDDTSMTIGGRFANVAV